MFPLASTAIIAVSNENVTCVSNVVQGRAVLAICMRGHGVFIQINRNNKGIFYEIHMLTIVHKYVLINKYVLICMRFWKKKNTLYKSLYGLLYTYSIFTNIMNLQLLCKNTDIYEDILELS